MQRVRTGFPRCILPHLSPCCCCFWGFARIGPLTRNIDHAKSSFLIMGVSITILMIVFTWAVELPCFFHPQEPMSALRGCFHVRRDVG